MSNVTAIILAAGRSTRMKSALPKVLHPVCGRPLVSYTLDAARNAGAHSSILVISAEFATRFEDVFKGQEGICFAVQEQQLGTADAVKAGLEKAERVSEFVLIIPGDVPLVNADTLKALVDDTIKADATIGLLTMKTDDPSGYGRIIRDSDGNLKAIVETRDATEEQSKINEVNSGIYCVRTSWLIDNIGKITPNNAQKEYYITDIVRIASDSGKRLAATCVKDASELMGINTRRELAEANRLMRARIIDRLMSKGVGILDGNNTYIDEGVVIGNDTTVGPNCVFSGKTEIGQNCIIENGVVIRDSRIGNGVHILPYSVIEESEILGSSTIGPFARLRPGAVIEEKAKVGNFVEIKKATIKKGAKANHLTYIGDAIIGERTNVGCGMITCNYDGKNKHRTIIGNDVFIGSDVQFVAPVEVGDNATIAAGSTITENVPKNSLAIARQRQIVKTNWRPNK